MSEPTKHELKDEIMVLESERQRLHDENLKLKQQLDLAREQVSRYAKAVGIAYELARIPVDLSDPVGMMIRIVTDVKQKIELNRNKDPYEP